MEGQIGCKVYFFYASVYNILSPVGEVLLALSTGANDDGEDESVEICTQGSEIDEGALNAATIVFMICGIFVYSLGIFGALKRNKKALQCYIAGMIVITIVHVAFVLINIVKITSGGIDKDAYTECFKKKVNNFYENDTTSSIDDFFHKSFCCSPDNDIVDFWKSITWHKDPTRTDTNVEVPIQCCNKNHPECRIKGGDQYRRTGCWDVMEFGQAWGSTFAVASILTWGIVLSLDVFLMYCVIRWLKSKPDVQPAQPTYELQGQTHQTYQPAAYQAQGQTPPPYQPAYQGAQGQTQPAYQQPGYQPPYQSPGQPQPTYQAQGETDPAYQPPQPYQGYQPNQAYKPPQA